MQSPSVFARRLLKITALWRLVLLPLCVTFPTTHTFLKNGLAWAAPITSHPAPCWRPQRSVLGPLLFAVYCSPVADVIASHGVQHYQYGCQQETGWERPVCRMCCGCAWQDVAGCRQNTGDAERTPAQSRQIGSTDHRRRHSAHAVSSAVSSVSIAGVDLPVADQMKVLGVVLD